MREYYIAGNWKMNNTASQAREFAEALVDELKDASAKMMIAPPFTALESVSSIVRGTNIVLGAQNMSHKESGAYTGDISPEMLLDLDVAAVILGHSERRIVFGETDELINEKIKLALSKGLEVVFCIGETLDEREAGKVESVVRTQVTKGLSGVDEGSLKHVTIAYEPVWAIGTGRTATPEDANNVHQFVRSLIKELYSADASDRMVIQYGGSVKPDNVKELLDQSDIDGALVGGASLDLESFRAIALCKN